MRPCYQTTYSAGVDVSFGSAIGYRSGATGVLTFHGRNGGGQDLFSYTFGSVPLQMMMDAGYVVLSSSNGGSLNWGNDASQTQTTSDKATIQASPFNARSGKVFLSAFSMGGIAALRWAKNNPTLVHGLILIDTAADIDYFYTHGYTAEIDTAYGGSAAYAAAKASVNPMANAASYANIPMRLFSTTDDTTVPPADNNAAFASAVNSATCIYSTTGTGGHTPATVPRDTLINWMQSVAAP